MLAQPTPIDALTMLRQAGMEPDRHQTSMLTSTARQQLWLAHRQFGKSLCVADLAWAEACTVPGSLTLLISRSQRQASELFRKVKTFVRTSPGPALIRDTELSLETRISSRIVSLPASPDTVVGYTAPGLVIIDEAARVHDALYYALRPMLAMSRGRLIALSTPWGQRGWFYEAWQTHHTEQAMDAATAQALLADLGMAVPPDLLWEEDGTAFQWERFKVTAPDNPRLHPFFLANERRSVPDLIFRSEWLCEFIAATGAVFDFTDLERMMSDEIAPLWSAEYEDDAVSAALLPLFSK